MIEFRNVAYSYAKGEPVLKDISFQMDQGDCVCLLGPNGTGKTTLLKCLLHTLRPSGGSILVDGKSIGAMNAKERASNIAYVAQSTQLSFPYSVEEVVMMGRVSAMRLGASPSRRDREIVEAVIEKLGITNIIKKNFQKLSGGQRQMVLFARALAQQARYLVLDEPTAALDYSNQIRILQTIRSLSDEGYGILMTSHFPDHAFLSCNQAVLIRDGLILESGDPKTVVTSHSLSELYQVPVCVADSTFMFTEREIVQRVCVPILEN